MARVYTVQFDATAETASFDIIELIPAANKPIAIVCVDIGQTTELGDAQEEELKWSIQRGGTAMTSGSGGSAPTPVPLDPTDTAAAFTAEVLNTTVATFTAGTVPYRSAYNVRNGLFYLPTPEAQIMCHNGNGGIVVRCDAAPADSITFTGTITVREVGIP